MDEYDRREIRDRLVMYAVGVGGALALAYGLAGEARSHEALPTATQPLGWTYGWECCSLKDCEQAKPGDISETPEGYRVNKTGEIVPYTDPKRIKMSRDEHFHWCRHLSGPHKDQTICIYKPDAGY